MSAVIVSLAVLGSELALFSTQAGPHYASLDSPIVNVGAAAVTKNADVHRPGRGVAALARAQPPVAAPPTEVALAIPQPVHSVMEGGR